MEDYQKFIESKRIKHNFFGHEAADENLNSNLSPFQLHSVKIALKRGRFALFEDTGLGKKSNS